MLTIRSRSWAKAGSMSKEKLGLESIHPQQAAHQARHRKLQKAGLFLKK
jgi:hypothetical protein